MSPPVSADPVPSNSVDEDDYVSSEDEDFNPDAADPEADPNTSDSNESQPNDESGRRLKKRKQRETKHGDNDKNNEDDSGDDDDGDGDFANSGDEATIRKGKRRKARGGLYGLDDGGDEDDDGGGEGGLIKTRAQRAREGKEKKPLANAATSTVDVDALWAGMNTVSVVQNREIQAQTSAAQEGTEKPLPSSVDEKITTDRKLNGHDGPNPSAGSSNTTAPTAPTALPDDDDEMITIKRTYDFAGETIHEEKRVPKSSAEARLYLNTTTTTTTTTTTKKPLSASAVPHPPLRRPKKRASLFDPSSSSTTSPSTSSSSSTTHAKTVHAPPPPKLNTIEKSKLDWAGFVDREEGLSQDLDGHARGKEGYLGRMDFLHRVQERREDGLKR